MLKIKFDALSFMPDAVTTNKDALPQATSFLESSSVDDTWQGEVRRIQTIYCPNYEVVMYMRDVEFINFQNIKYSSNVEIFYSDEKSYKSRGDLIIISPEFDTPVSGIIKVTMTFGDLNEQKIENTINQFDPVDKISFGTDSGDFLNLFLPVKKITNLEINEVTSFNNIVNDYKKITKTVDLRFYLNYEDFNYYINILADVKPNGYYIKTNSLSEEFTQFKMEQEEIGNDLFKIDLHLYYNSRIKQEY